VRENPNLNENYRPKRVTSQRKSTGQLAKVTSQFEGVEGEAGGKLYRYRLSGDINTELWYDVRGLLAKARFNARGSVFEFSRPPEATQISSETNSLKGGS
jgi:hypothetical protein